jgi:hypothetical protein
MTSRRALVRRLAAVAGAAGLSGCSTRGDDGRERAFDLSPNPRADRLPRRQHAWAVGLDTDAHGNALPPRYHRALLLETDAERSASAARTVEGAMRTLEAAHEWRSDGLFHVLAWGTRYFERRGRLSASPIRRPRVLSRTDDPELEAFDAALFLASDVPSHLTAADAAMFGDRDRLGGVAVGERLGDVFSVASRRTGFMGEGLPAAHTAAEGVPDSVPADAPMFTGFFSGRSRTQASEDRVTISGGEYDGGTTAHLSHLRESLDGWWDALDDEGRVARMFSARFSSDDVADFDEDVPVADAVRERAREHGVVGHHEKVARARVGGEPRILRRDFNTTDGGQAGLHFLSFQRSLSDLERTRKAMNGWYLRDDHPDVGEQENNGLLDFVTVTRRANFHVPPRDRRAFPK